MSKISLRHLLPLTSVRFLRSFSILNFNTIHRANNPPIRHDQKYLQVSSHLWGFLRYMRPTSPEIATKSPKDSIYSNLCGWWSYCLLNLVVFPTLLSLWLSLLYLLLRRLWRSPWEAEKPDGQRDFSTGPYNCTTAGISWASAVCILR